MTGVVSLVDGEENDEATAKVAALVSCAESPTEGRTSATEVRPAVPTNASRSLLSDNVGDGKVDTYDVARDGDVVMGSEGAMERDVGVSGIVGCDVTLVVSKGDVVSTLEPGDRSTDVFAAVGVKRTDVTPALPGCELPACELPACELPGCELPGGGVVGRGGGTRAGGASRRTSRGVGSPCWPAG